MIYFSNPGLIDLNGLKTFGLTSKSGETSKIGRFGTGLKYAVAVILRKGGVMTIRRGRKSHVLRTIEESFRGAEVLRIVMDDEPLAFTTDLGRDWEPWMAFRELYSNALDEGGNVSSSPGSDGEGSTSIAVDMPAFEAIHDTMEEHFIAPDEQPIWESEHIRVFRGSTEFVFYRGISVFKLKKRAAFRYDLKGYIDLSEDRTAKYSFQVLDNIAAALVTCETPEILSSIVSNSSEFEGGLDFTDSSVPNPSQAFIGAAAAAGSDCSPSAAALVREQLPDSPDQCTVFSRATPGAEALSAALGLLRSLGADLSICKFVLADGVSMYRDWESRRETIFLSESIFENQKRMNRAVFEGYNACVGKHWLTDQLIKVAEMENAA